MASAFNAVFVGWPYFDYQKPGHSARQTDGPTQMILEVYSKIPLLCHVWIENGYIVIWKQDMSWENRSVGHFWDNNFC